MAPRKTTRPGKATPEPVTNIPPSVPGPAEIVIIMGSQSDWDTMRHAADTLAELNLGVDARIISAHRTPDRLYAFAKSAKAQGHKIIIAGAGGAAWAARRLGG